MQHHPLFQLASVRLFSVVAMATVLSACGSSSGSNGTATIENSSRSEQTEPVVSTLVVPDSLTALGTVYTVVGNTSVLTPELSVATADFSGRTLYTFDNDSVNRSVCTDRGCLSSWLPVLVSDSDTPQPPLGSFARADGQQQWTLYGQPLYFFSGDQQVGDVNGHGLNGVWHAAKAEPATVQRNEIDGEYLAFKGLAVTTANFYSSGERQDKSGFALYTFDQDERGLSRCDQTCLENWPALLLQDVNEIKPPYSVIHRAYGSAGETVAQLTLNGAPLYFYSGDTLAGDTQGAAIAGWQLARPVPAVINNNTSASHWVAEGMILQARPADAVENDGVTAAEVIDERLMHGMSLYTFDLDDSGVSQCEGDCLMRWPALMARQGAQPNLPFTLIERQGGGLQWALNDQPLYFYHADNKAGDTKGDGVGGVWHLAHSAPIMVRAGSSESDQNSSSTFMVGHGNLLNVAGESDVSRNGFTLYTFDLETDGTFDADTDVSKPPQLACFGTCAERWPPLYASKDDNSFGNFTIIRRDNPATDSVEDEYQWMHANRPLYFYTGDTAPGETNGDGIGGVWHIARP